jgi:stage II sporulation protein D
VADPYNAGPAFSWRIAISFNAVAGRLRGVLKGAFRGIAVLTRGASPRIVTAEVLGSRGATPVSGPELAQRLGLGSTWAYFSVQNGRSVRPLPDRSGRTAPVPTSPSTPAPTPAGPQGGAAAPGAPGAAQASTGGVSAG